MKKFLFLLTASVLPALGFAADKVCWDFTHPQGNKDYPVTVRGESRIADGALQVLDSSGKIGGAAMNKIYPEVAPDKAFRLTIEFELDGKFPQKMPFMLWDSIFLVTDATCKLGSKVALKVESGVIQKLLCNLDNGADLVCADELLTEGIITIGDCAFLINPRGSTLRSHNRDFVATGSGLEYVSMRTNYLLVTKRLNERFLKGVGNEVTALGVGAYLESVANFIRITLSCVVPESIIVSIGSSAYLGIRLGGLGFAVRGVLVARDISLSIASSLSIRAISLPRSIISCSIRE